MARRGSTHPFPNRWDTAVRITTARVECTTCGPTIAPFDDVALVAAGETLWYQFTCPSCGSANTVTTAPYATDLLVMSGVRIHLVGTPREAQEPHPVRAWTQAEIDAVFAEIDTLGR